MNLANKVFRDNQTGKEIRVLDTFEDIAILENKQKINVNLLMNSDLFTEKVDSDKIDPSLFFNNQGTYNILADKIKNIPADKIVDDDNSEVIINMDTSNNSMPPISNESAVIISSEEDERAEIARKYGVTDNIQTDLERQNNAFAKLLSDDDNDDSAPIVVSNDLNNFPKPKIVDVPIQKVDDPIITMFKNVKRNVNFSIKLDVVNKIPRLDFIEMMEDSYETSIIDFLSKEFTNKLLENPEIIENMISDEIKKLVYKANVDKKPVVRKVVAKKPVVRKTVVKKVE